MEGNTSHFSKMPENLLHPSSTAPSMSPPSCCFQLPPLRRAPQRRGALRVAVVQGLGRGQQRQQGQVALRGGEVQGQHVLTLGRGISMENSMEISQIHGCSHNLLSWDTTPCTMVCIVCILVDGFLKYSYP